MTHRLASPCEWVAPLTPIISLALLPLGPILFPRFYVVFLFVYFTGFLYQQVNHVCKFYLTSQRIRANIDAWNAINKNSTLNDKSMDDKAKIDTYQSKNTLSELSFEEQSLYQEPNYIHTFVIPNYSEPEALLKDTISKLAAHR